jgi:phosphoglycerate kinase
MSHLGRPDGKRVEKDSLSTIVPTVEKELGSKVLNKISIRKIG